ncbi:hypothetical protein C8J56DRAFT_967006 [Mycena floridula]|nr:hypothetical protein C8J56DRAFT_967006 [Mycena floridula]
MKTSRSFNVRSFEEQRIWELPWSAEREKWQCLPHDIRFGASVCLYVPNPQSSRAESAASRFLSTFHRPSEKHHSCEYYTIPRQIHDLHGRLGSHEFVQSGGLIHDTLFCFGTVLVVKRHAHLDCLSLLVSSTTGLTIAKLSRPKLSLISSIVQRKRPNPMQETLKKPANRPR